MFKGVAFDAYGTLFDVFSVAQKCEIEYPGKGAEISKVWREKQLEYSWLQTLMGRYKNFWRITEDALCYSLKSFGLLYDADKINEIMSSYVSLTTYPEVMEALPRFRPRKLAILTNGNPEMLNKLIVRTELNRYLDGVLSADTVQLFKPKPEVYQLAVDFLEQASVRFFLFLQTHGILPVQNPLALPRAGLTVWINPPNS